MDYLVALIEWPPHCYRTNYFELVIFSCQVPEGSPRRASGSFTPPYLAIARWIAFDERGHCEPPGRTSYGQIDRQTDRDT